MCLLLAVAGFLINLDINYVSPPHISVRFTPSLVQTAFPMLGRTSEGTLEIMVVFLGSVPKKVGCPLAWLCVAMRLRFCEVGSPEPVPEPLDFVRRIIVILLRLGRLHRL